MGSQCGYWLRWVGVWLFVFTPICQAVHQMMFSFWSWGHSEFQDSNFNWSPDQHSWKDGWSSGYNSGLDSKRSHIDKMGRLGDKWSGWRRGRTLQVSSRVWGPVPCGTGPQTQWLVGTPGLEHYPHTHTHFVYLKTGSHYAALASLEFTM